MKPIFKSIPKCALLLFLLSGLFLVACGGSPPSGESDEGVSEVPVVDVDFDVTVEGKLVPNDSVWLAFRSSGQVAELLVDEGDAVKAGDIIARLGDREQLESNIANAELEMLLAELDVLSTEIEIHSAELEWLTAQDALNALHENWPTATTAAQQTFKDARQTLHDADRRLNILRSTASEADIDLAKSALVLAEDDLDKAEEDFKPYEDKPESNLTRAAFQSKLAAAQKAYDDAVRTLNGLQGTANDFDISQAETELLIAQTQFAQAQEDYEELLEGPDPDDVAIAEARIATAESRVATAKGRFDSIEGRIKAAKAAVAAAQAALDNLDLVATIDGTVVELDLIVGEQVSPGTPVVLVADYSQWYVETDDLTEIEVVDIAVDQEVKVAIDALPEVELVGSVDSISDVFEEKRGDITYTTRILVDEVDPRLRWGMTVVVTFENLSGKASQ